MTTSLPGGRRHHILDLVRRHGEAKVGPLAAELGVRPVTVRRDIAALAREGLVEQVHGGARRAGTDPVGAPAAERTPAADGPRLDLVVPSLRYYWPGIVAGAREAAARLGVTLRVHGSAGNAEANLQVVEQILARGGCDALLIGPELRGGAASDRLVRRLASLPVPVVLLERGLDEHGPVVRGFDSVRTDHSLGAALAVRHLHELGHTRIAYEGDPGTPSDPFVRAGYRRAVHLLGLDEVAQPPRALDPFRDRPSEVLGAVLRRFADEGTTGALVHSDVPATLLLQHALRIGLPIPGELSLVAYDDELAVTSDPALTAVAPPKHALGERAVALALHRCAHPDAPTEHVMLVPALHARETTAPPG